MASHFAVQNTERPNVSSAQNQRTGVPMATIVDQHLGWRATFWLVFAPTVICSLIVSALVPKSRHQQTISLGAELAEFRPPYLWAAYTTSALIIGATFAAFAYFAPILTEISGFTPAVIPWLLGVYGMANVIGNTIVGRYADHYTIPIMMLGLITLSVPLILLALLA